MLVAATLDLHTSAHDHIAKLNNPDKPNTASDRLNTTSDRINTASDRLNNPDRLNTTIDNLIPWDPCCVHFIID
jgi:hypothetical protein